MAAVDAARPQLEALVRGYGRVLPPATFPYLPLAVAAGFQSAAWFGGRFMSGLTLVPRVLALWGLALGEYSFMSPAMNAATRVLGMTEPSLVVVYTAITLAVFVVANALFYRQRLRPRHWAGFALLLLAAALTSGA